MGYGTSNTREEEEIWSGERQESLGPTRYSTVPSTRQTPRQAVVPSSRKISRQAVTPSHTTGMGDGPQLPSIPSPTTLRIHWTLGVAHHRHRCWHSTVHFRLSLEADSISCLLSHRVRVCQVCRASAEGARKSQSFLGAHVPKPVLVVSQLTVAYDFTKQGWSSQKASMYTCRLCARHRLETRPSEACQSSP